MSYRSTYRKIIFVLMMCGVCVVANSQDSLRIIKATSKSVDVTDGGFFRKGHWMVSPEVRPDVYYPERFKGKKSVTFRTDVDSITIDVENGQTYDFVILLNGKDSAFTTISTESKKLSYTRQNGQARASDTIHFTLSWQNKIHFKGKINDSEPLDMMFDTGANGVVMSEDAYGKDVKLKLAGTVQGFGLGGSTEDDLSNGNKLSIDGLAWNDVSLTVKKQGKPSEDVVIGYNVFDGKIVEIDYDKKILVLHDAMPSLGEKFTRHELRFRGGLSYILVKLNTGKKVIEGWFDFDTGSSNTLFLNKDFSVEHSVSEVMKKTGSGSLRGSGPQKIKTEKTVVPELIIGNVSLKEVPIEMESAQSNSSTPFNIIGSDILKRFNIFIDYQNDVVYLSPNNLQNDMYFANKVKIIMYAGVIVLLAIIAGGVVFVRRYRRKMFAVKTAMLALFMIFSSTIFAQQKEIKGRITDQDNKPIAGASVYLSNTSKGVTTSSSGDFQLSNLPTGKYDLVISAIGYETKVIAISSEKYPDNLSVRLTKFASELSTVVVEPFDKNGWSKWGQYFIENFIGKTHNAKFCKITNNNVIRFRFSEKNNRLTAKADEPLVIENKVLGYRVKFQLIEFTADFNTGMVAYYGYPFFTEMDVKKKALTLENRRRAYYGSLMHFMRAVFSDDVVDESFVVRAVVPRPNFEKQRVKDILAYAALDDSLKKVPEDSIKYYRKVLKQRDTLTERRTLQSLSPFVAVNGASSKSFYFNDIMEVVYTGKSSRRADVSEIMLETPLPLEIAENGSYVSPKELITYKYWGESEKLCNMLPFDYNP